MSYCVNCGSALQPGAKYCSSCGTAVASGAVETRPRRVPAIDYVRDGLAAFALILSLFTVWSAGGERSGQFTGNLAAENLAVLVVTLVSIASLSIPYLWRAGIFGPAWSYKKTQDARLVANAPYFLLVLVYLIIEVVAHPGLGPAVAFGLAGAILAAQPRSTELADGDVDRDRRWIAAALVIAGVVAVLTLVQIIQAAMLFDAASMTMIALLALGNAALLAVVALAVARRSNPWRLVGVGMGMTAAILGLLSLSPQFVLTKMTTTALFPSFSLAFWMAFGAAVSAPSVARLMKRREPELVGAESGDTGGNGVRAEHSTAKPVGWLPALRPTIDVAIGVSALTAIVALVAVIRLTTPGENVQGFVSAVPFVLALVFGVVGVVGGVVVRRMAKRDQRQGHVLATAYAALLFLLGLVLVILWSAFGLGNIAPLTLLIAFAIPAGLLLILWGTPAARDYFGSLPQGDTRYNFAGLQPDAPGREPREDYADSHADSRDAEADHGAAEASGAAAWAQLAEPDEDVGSRDATGATAVLPDDMTQRLERAGQGASDPTLEAIRAEAANRKTSAIRLREIASTVPEARAAVASNPKAYPDLLTWLGNLGDPDVDAALERRKR